MAKLDMSKYGAVSDLMKTRSAGLKSHEANLNAEIAANDGSHAYGRHGFQIGWQAQLVRCATQVAPDQEFDPSGTGGVIRRWNSLSYNDRMLDGSGAAIATDLIGPFNPELTDYKTVAGIMSGGFLGPEHQEGAEGRARGDASSVRHGDKGLRLLAGGDDVPRRQHQLDRLPSRPSVLLPRDEGEDQSHEAEEVPPANTKKFGHLNFNKDLYDWTGRTSNIEMTTYLNHPVPAWI